MSDEQSIRYQIYKRESQKKIIHKSCLICSRPINESEVCFYKGGEGIHNSCFIKKGK